MPNIESDIRPEDFSEIKHIFGNDTRKAIKRIASLVLVGSALNGPIVGKVSAESGWIPSADGLRPGVEEKSGKTISSIENELFGQFPYYDIKLRQTENYKEMLKEHECQEINLDFCADLLYAWNKSIGFHDINYDKPEKTILRNYLTYGQIYEFGKTGKGLDVVYFKDEKGKKTNEPALLYVVNPEEKKFKISDVEKGIDFWEKLEPGFLRAMVNNDVRVLLQSQASSNKEIGVFNYDDGGVIYYNVTENDSNDFSHYLRKGFAVEQFGVKGDALGIYTNAEVGVIKSWLARDCLKYIAKKTGKDYVKGTADAFQMELDDYLFLGRLRLEQIDLLVKGIKDNKLMTPFGAETWEEIDSINK